MKKAKQTPKMSWEKPIEEETLKFCLSMARQFRRSELHNEETGWFANNSEETGWFANNSFSKECGAMAMAYETVANHIKEEIRMRERINQT